MARFHVDRIDHLGDRTGGSKESLTGPTDNTDSNYRRTWGVGRLNIYDYRILIVFTSKCCTVRYAIRASRSWDSKQCETEEEIKENPTGPVFYSLITFEN